MANKLIATVSPGKTFTADETVDNDKLNQLGLPTVDMANSLVTNDTFEPGPFAYGAAGGTGDALTVTLNPALASLAAGTFIQILATAANTTAATINVNGLGVKAITKWGSVPLVAGDIFAGLMMDLRYDGTRWQLLNPGLIPVPIGSARGLLVKTNAGTPNSKVDIAATQVVVQTSGGSSALLQGVAVTADITVSGAAGLDTGVEAISTWYYVWLIWNGTTVAGLLSVSGGAPTMPTGYTHKALVGAVRNDGASNFVKFWQVDRTVYQAEQNVITATAAAVPATYENLSLAAFVPAIAREVFGNAGSSNGTASQLIIAGDANGVGACVIATPTSGVTTDGFLSGGRFAVPLMVAAQLTWQATDVTAHNRISVSGYTI